MQALASYIFVCMVVVTAGHGVNYCGAKMCGYTNAHTLCQFVDMFGPLCVGYLEGGLSGADKAHILARLNRRRNDVASGKIPGLPSAGNMLKLRWVEELAREAQLWADQCRPVRAPEEHDACRDLYSINVGQCVASVVGEAPGMKIESMVDIWFMQNKYFKGNITSYEPPEPNKYFYGDFAQMIWARTFMVGCGRSRFLFPMNGRPRSIERLVCNFAPQGPTPYRPLWTPSVPATACPSRARPARSLTSLCDYHNELNQPSDIDDTMTIEDHILLNAVLEMERNETIFQGSLDEIYLTYLAMITMQSPEIVTIPHFNSIQKRDIVEKIYLDAGINVNESYPMIDDFDKSYALRNNITKLQKKLQTVGRPKAYKMDELSHTEDIPKNEHHDMTEAVMRRKKEFYYDYHNDFFEENVTMHTEGISEFNTHENTTFDDHIIQRGNEMTPVTLSHEVHDTFTNEDEAHAFKTQWANISVQEYNVSRTLASDDYLNDPETVRELQAALDRMEHEAANASSTRKTRRQVEDYPEPQDHNKNEILNTLSTSDSSLYTMLTGADVPTDTIQDTNTSNETPVVLNMMMKYMPYLRNYENDLLGNGKSSARRVCPSVLLMIGAMRV